MNKTTDRQYVQMELPFERIGLNYDVKDIKRQSDGKISRGFWTFEHCKIAASRCRTIKEYRKSYPGAYQASKRNKWIERLGIERIRQTNGYWTREMCEQAAKGCYSIDDFSKKYSRAYAISLENGWLDEWFERKVHKKGYWTKNQCMELALECESISQFESKSSRAYLISRENGWLDEFFHRKTKPKGFWNKERCMEVAKKCDTITQFQKLNHTAYQTSLENGWLDEWFERKVMPRGFYSKEKCIELSKRCKTRYEFFTRYRSAYKKSLLRGWIEEFMWLSCPENVYTNGFYVYSYEFYDNAVYIGITSQKNGNRDKQHRDPNGGSAVFAYSKENNIPIPQYKILKDKMSAESAKYYEAYYIKSYRDKGWKVINRAKAGSIGGVGYKWTIKRTREVAMRCKSVTEFQKKYGGAFSAAYRRGWIKDYNWLYPTRKGFLAYDNLGIIKKVYSSIAEVREELGYSKSQCYRIYNKCRRHGGYAYGYFWRYAPTDGTSTLPAIGVSGMKLHRHHHNEREEQNTENSSYKKIVQPEFSFAIEFIS